MAIYYCSIRDCGSVAKYATKLRLWRGKHEGDMRNFRLCGGHYADLMEGEWFNANPPVFS